jgi:hypothetical protein
MNRVRSLARTAAVDISGQLMTVKDVATHLQVKQDWVRRRRREHGAIRLNGSGRGTDLRFFREKVDGYLERGAR